jgi:hypothetical protein
MVAKIAGYRPVISSIVTPGRALPPFLLIRIQSSQAMTLRPSRLGFVIEATLLDGYCQLMGGSGCGTEEISAFWHYNRYNPRLFFTDREIL